MAVEYQLVLVDGCNDIGPDWRFIGNEPSFRDLPLRRADGEPGLTKWTWTPEAAGAAAAVVDVAEAEAAAAIDF